MSPLPHVDLACSVLLFRQQLDQPVASVEALAQRLEQAAFAFGIRVALIVGLNVAEGYPAPGELGTVAARLDALASRTRESGGAVSVVVNRFGINLGFGGGHNRNLRAFPARYHAILNDDIEFTSFDFLPLVLQAFQDETVAAVGDANSPGYLVAESLHGSPHVPPAQDRAYLEGSILFVRASVFEQLHGFDEQFAYGYFEDVDLAFRLKAAGWKLVAVDIPHRHFRSQSTASLSPGVYTRLQETNRALFSAKWGTAVRERRGPTGAILIDLESAGFGDIVAAFPSVREFCLRQSQQGRTLAIHVSQPGLGFLFRDLPASLHTDIAELAGRQFDSVISIRPVNYSAPFNIHQIFAAVFALDALPALVPPRIATATEPPAAPYCIVHLDTGHAQFHGRIFTKTQLVPALERIGRGMRLVFVGAREGDAVDGPFEAWLEGRVAAGGASDLRDRTSLEELYALVAAAHRFFGIDSGPLHFAQLLSVPSLGLFGAVHPCSRVYDKSKLWPYARPQLPCIGCYHLHPERSISFCLRTDQACTSEVQVEALDALVDDFLSAAPFDWRVLEPSWQALQARSLFLQIHNPILGNRLVYSSLPLKKVTDAVLTGLWGIERVARDRAIELAAANAQLADELARRDADIDRLIRPAADVGSGPGRGAEPGPAGDAAPEGTAGDTERLRVRPELVRHFRSDVRVGAQVVSGTIYPDGWTTSDLQLSIFPHAPVGTVFLQFFAPKVRGARLVRLFADGVLADEKLVDGGAVARLTAAGGAPAFTPVLLSLEVRQAAGKVTPEQGAQDKRDLGVVLRTIGICKPPAAA